MKYVALIRGINVGGNNIIKMEALRKAFTSAGFKDVTTYIQSGNIFFESGESKVSLIIAKVEKLIEKEFGIKVSVVVKSQKEIEKIIVSLPKLFTSDDHKHNVAFLRDEIDDAKLLKKFLVSDEVDTISYLKGVLFTSTNKALATRSRLSKIVKEKEYKLMTIRNLNTMRKLYDLMKGE